MTRPDPNERAARLTRATSDEPAALTPAVLVVVTLGLGEGATHHDVEVGDTTWRWAIRRRRGSPPEPPAAIPRRSDRSRAGPHCPALLVAARR